MKKYLVINLASILLLLGCSNDDSQDESIDFNFTYSSSILQDGNISIDFDIDSESYEIYNISQTSPDYSCCNYGYLLNNNINIIKIDGQDEVNQINSQFNIKLEDSSDGIYYSSFLITPKQSGVNGKILSIQYRRVSGNIDFVAIIYNKHRERNKQTSIFSYDFYSSSDIELNYLLNENEVNDTNKKPWFNIDVNNSTNLTFYRKSTATGILKLYPQ